MFKKIKLTIIAILGFMVFAVPSVHAIDVNINALLQLDSLEGLSKRDILQILIDDDATVNALCSNIPDCDVTIENFDIPTTSPIVLPNTQQSSLYCGPFTQNQTLASFGTEVVRLQNALERSGHLVVPAGVAKGYFGALTRHALISWQIQNNVQENGYFGAETRSAFDSLCTDEDVVPSFNVDRVYGIQTQKNNVLQTGGTARLFGNFPEDVGEFRVRIIGKAYQETLVATHDFEDVLQFSVPSDIPEADGFYDLTVLWGNRVSNEIRFTVEDEDSDEVSKSPTIRSISKTIKKGSLASSGAEGGMAEFNFYVENNDDQEIIIPGAVMNTVYAENQEIAGVEYSFTGSVHAGAPSKHSSGMEVLGTNLKDGAPIEAKEMNGFTHYIVQPGNSAWLKVKVNFDTVNKTGRYRVNLDRLYYYGDGDENTRKSKSMSLRTDYVDVQALGNDEEEDVDDKAPTISNKSVTIKKGSLASSGAEGGMSSFKFYVTNPADNKEDMYIPFATMSTLYAENNEEAGAEYSFTAIPYNGAPGKYSSNMNVEFNDPKTGDALKYDDNFKNYLHYILEPGDTMEVEVTINFDTVSETGQYRVNLDNLWYYGNGDLNDRKTKSINMNTDFVDVTKLGEVLGSSTGINDLTSREIEIIELLRSFDR